MKIEIPTNLQFLKNKFVSVDYLTRFGGFRDGGYVLPSNAVLNSNALISGGVGSNARFERDCFDYNPNLDVVLIDKSTSSSRMLLRVCYHIVKHGWTIANISLMEFFSYRSMRNNSIIIRKYLSKFYDLNNVFSDLNLYNRNVLLKLDIEGSEYEILDSIISNEKCISAVVIEFHDVHLQENIEKIKHFVLTISLDLIYISINETSLDKNGSCPKIVELTFSKAHKSIAADRFLQSHCFPSKECEPIYFHLID